MIPADLSAGKTPPAVFVGGPVCDISITGLDRFASAEFEFSERSDVWHDQPARLLPAGTAGNAALVCAALASRSRLVGPIADDLMGRAIAAEFRSNGVELHATPALSTASHVIVNSIDGRRQAYFHPGSNLDLAAVPRQWLTGPLLLTGLNLAVARPIIPGVLELAHAAHEAGQFVALDIGQAGPDMLTFDELCELDGAVDALIGSSHEWHLVLDGQPAREMRDLQSIHPGHIVVKRGPDGAEHYRPGKTEPVSVPAPKVQAINPVGAGDAFAGAFMAMAARGADIASAIRIGCAAGAAAVEQAGGPVAVKRDRVMELAKGI